MTLRHTTLVLMLLSAMCATGCRTAYKPDVARGAAAPKSPSVVIFPITCHSADDKCRDEYSDAVTAKVRSELEFAGFRMIDGEKLVRETRTREDASATLTDWRNRVLAAKSRRQVGAIFEDLPPAARRELLAEARADGLVTGSIRMLPFGTPRNWTVEVQVRFGLANDDEMVWVSRCKNERFWNEKDSWSIEQATECALRGALARDHSG